MTAISALFFQGLLHRVEEVEKIVKNREEFLVMSTSSAKGPARGWRRRGAHSLAPSLGRPQTSTPDVCVSASWDNVYALCLSGAAPGLKGILSMAAHCSLRAHGAQGASCPGPRVFS